MADTGLRLLQQPDHPILHSFTRPQPMRETTYMAKPWRIASIAGLLLLVAGGCKDFLTCTECVNDPNRPSAATNTQLFVGIQSNLMATLGSDMARVTGILAQQFSGGLQQYFSLESTYEINEQTTNGFHTGI